VFFAQLGEGGRSVTHGVRAGHGETSRNHHQQVVGSSDIDPKQKPDKVALIVESNAIISKPRTVVYRQLSHIEGRKAYDQATKEDMVSSARLDLMWTYLELFCQFGTKRVD
jgi:hypothetical protein